MEEASTVVLNQIFLILLIAGLDDILEIGHFARRSEDSVFTDLSHSPGVFMLEHGSVGDTAIGTNHDSILISQSEHTCACVYCHYFR